MTKHALFSTPQSRLMAYTAFWVACFAAAGMRYSHARGEFTRPATADPATIRADGGSGHAEIDFGGQYVLGKMVLLGQARHLYDRRAQWPVVREVFPAEGGSPAQRDGRERSDAESMMYWFVGTDPPERLAVQQSAASLLAAQSPLAALPLVALAQSQVNATVLEALNRPIHGGPLYPPTHAILYAPLANWPAPQAYKLFQQLCILLAFVSGAMLSRIVRGRVWWPAATLFVLLFPNHQSGMDLAQNQTVSLTIFTAGWLARSRGYALAAGLIWGCFAFKPTWAVAFLLVPIYLREWRFLLGMVVGGAMLVLLTLPIVGLQAWFDWLEVGQLATAEYAVNKNWTGLSRDLGGLFRRVLVNFDASPVVPSSLAGVLNLVALAVVVGGTAAVAVRRIHPGTLAETTTGFVLLGAYLGCYRFVYYDSVLAVLPVFLLVADPARWRLTRITLDLANGPLLFALPSLTLVLVAVLFWIESQLKWLGLQVSLAVGALGGKPSEPGAVPLDAPRLVADTSVYTATDTLILLTLWLWVGLKLWRGQPINSVNAAPMSGERIKDSPTKTA